MKRLILCCSVVFFTACAGRAVISDADVEQPAPQVAVGTLFINELVRGAVLSNLTECTSDLQFCDVERADCYHKVLKAVKAARNWKARAAQLKDELNQCEDPGKHGR